MSGLRRAIVKILQKTGMNKIAHRVYYDYLQNFEARGREVGALLHAIEKSFAIAVERGTAARGDYYEFGLFKGNSFCHAQEIALAHSDIDMRFFGFDSFQGLPLVKGHDETNHNEFYEGQYACGKDQVIANMNTRGVDWNRTVLIEGFYEQSLNPETRRKWNMEKAAIALIDCDLYSSTAEVLSFLDGMLMDGSILIFDDWNCFDASDEKGQRRAFREFLEKNDRYRAKELFAYGNNGQVFDVSEGNRASIPA